MPDSRGNRVLERDVDIVLPSVAVVAASAGSGKTFALTRRFVQILLSERIPHTALRNLLAITFTNNAAKEMRQEVLTILKNASLGDKTILEQLRDLVSMSDNDIRKKSTRLVDEIFENFSDFRVRTIDSFMTTVFKSSAIEFGFHPDFDVLFSHRGLVREAFDILSRRLGDHPEEAELWDQLVNLLMQVRKKDGAYLWDPYNNLVTVVTNLHRMLAAQPLDPIVEDQTGRLKDIEERIVGLVLEMDKLAHESRLERKVNFDKYVDRARSRDILTLLDRSLPDQPVKKPPSAALSRAYQGLISRITPMVSELDTLLNEYALTYARHYYLPYLKAIQLIDETLTQLKRQHGQIFIDDVNKMLVKRLNEQAVPEIYFRLGDVIYHYLVDEFQDTSPIQWENLTPLIENSLSQGGSLFVVGDTKQSIYGFRGADWTIMKRMEDQDEFPSAPRQLRTLDTSYRSDGRIVEFTQHIFQSVIPQSDYADAAARSGLTTYKQEARDERKGKGYVEVSIIQIDEDAIPQRGKVLEIVGDCRARGYSLGDIAILTSENKYVVEVSSWLNAAGIRFISHSSLDIRKRKVTTELLAWLRFLDSPIDNLSFTTFLLSDVFYTVLSGSSAGITRDELRSFVHTSNLSHSPHPLYKRFADAYPQLWLNHCEKFLGLVGYLPLYDLVSEVYKSFGLFDAVPSEEATLVKLLEVIQTFEDAGNNSIKDFLEYALGDDERSGWEIDVPEGVDAVTVMTIHKAKGLGFPVVIVLAYDERPDYLDFIPEQDSDGIRLLRITRALAKKVPYLNDLYGEKRMKEQVDDLNKLYVALTRAKEEMYVVGIYNKVRSMPTSLLPESGYVPGPKPPVTREPRPAERLTKAHHTTISRLPEPKTYRKLALEETRRGELIHAVLARMEYIDGDPAQLLDSAIASTFESSQDSFFAASVKEALTEFLQKDEILTFFVRKNDRVVKTEQEVVTATGVLHRMDRLVFDSDAVTVIDFKTGGNEHEDEYRRQVRNYMNIVADTYPGRIVTGCIAYVDRKELKEVR